MINKLDETAKQVGETIINTISMIPEKMEKWSDLNTRPYDLDSDECAGFINKQDDETGGLEFVVDVEAPKDKQEATLRIWAINSAVDNEDNELFTNVQLDFSVEYDQGKVVAAKASTISLQDFKDVLQNQATKLERLVVSDNSGIDKVSKKPLGQRYDIAVSETDESDSETDAVAQALVRASDRLKELVEGQPSL